MKIRIVDKVKFIIRIIELIVVIVTIGLTMLGINYANQLRDYQGIGGEYLIPIFGFLIILIIEDIYGEYKTQKRKKNKKGEKIK